MNLRRFFVAAALLAAVQVASAVAAGLTPWPWWLLMFAPGVAASVRFGLLAAEGPRPDLVSPCDFRALMPDGSEVPLEFVYEGWREDCHRWRATLILRERPTEILGAELPPHTAVVISFVVRGDEERSDPPFRLLGALNEESES